MAGINSRRRLAIQLSRWCVDPPRQLTRDRPRLTSGHLQQLSRLSTIRSRQSVDPRAAISREAALLVWSGGVGHVLVGRRVRSVLPDPVFRKHPSIGYERCLAPIGVHICSPTETHTSGEHSSLAGAYVDRIQQGWETMARVATTAAVRRGVAGRPHVSSRGDCPVTGRVEWWRGCSTSCRQ